MNKQLPVRFNTTSFTSVTPDELQHVSGGGIVSTIKRVARWVKDHIYVDPKNRAGGVKGKF